jgi:DNA-binding SARP family transcriptional activator
MLRGVRIRLLGELEVVRDGRRLPLPASKRSRALLGYLVATGRPHLRSHLCDLLWDSPDDPRAALRWSLTKLRPLLDEPDVRRLQADRDRAGFEAHGAGVDWTEVQAVVRSRPVEASTDALRGAATLFGGEFLDGLDLPECYRYAAWLAAEREAVRTLHVSILETLVVRLHETPDEALAYARAWVAVDPLGDAAHAAVVRALDALGRSREALAHYDAARRTLESELRARPSPELERARRAVGAPSPAAPLPSRVAAAEPVIGRERERALIEGLVAVVAAGRGREGLLLLGEPGAGKTRLLDHLAEEGAAAGARVLRARAFEAEGVRPYGVWIDALRASPVASRAGETDLARLLPELGPAPVQGDQGRLFEAVAQALRVMAVRQPLIVALDDLQWLDEASLGLLHFAARELSGGTVLIAAAARPGELADNPAALRVVRALIRAGHLRQVEVGPLTADETARLARAIAPAVDAARVFGESQGNPLFAAEVTRALAAGEDRLSETLAGVIADRLLRLDADALELLPWAAALRREFDLQTLADVSARSPAEVVAAVDALERHGVLKVAALDRARYDFVHDLVREAAYRRMSSPRRRLVHAHIARVLGARTDAEGVLAGDVAHHAGLGGEDELCATACVAAGQRCLRLYAYAEALDMSRLGLAHAQALPATRRLPLQIALLRLRVHSALRPPDAADTEGRLEALVAEAEAAGLQEEVRAGLDALTFVHWYSGDLTGALEHTLRHAEASRAADPAAAARGLAATARCLAHLESDVPRAAALLQEARALAEAARVELLDVDWATGLIYRHQGRYDSACAWLERALRLGRQQADRYSEWDCLARMAMIELERGAPAAALERCQLLSALAARMSEGSEPAFALALAALARFSLNTPEAMGEVEQAVATLRALDSNWMLAYAQVSAAGTELERGHLGAARARAEEALAAAETVGRRSEAALAAALLARIALSESGADAARRALAAAVADAAVPGRLSRRAAAAVAEVAQGLGFSIPTVATTPPTTAAG